MAQADTYSTQQELVDAAVATWRIRPGSEEPDGWGADLAHSAAAPLLQLDLTVSKGAVLVSPSLAEAEEALLGTFDALLFGSFTDPYKALVVLGYGTDAAMVLPAKDDTFVLQRRSEVVQIVRAMLHPLQHLQDSFRHHYGDALAQSMAGFAEQRRNLPAAQLLQELQSLRQVWSADNLPACLLLFHELAVARTCSARRSRAASLLQLS